ncbi:OmpA family protein [Sphingomonas oryzagri]|uniref:OmpA family protein n=1 Tax=Sphingomonas oryzagri TaxID=3042314 RepID=A0ABT6N3H8_9SPHN|nr:OmpA family protein [Sphingomonas oryzagri]MDH7639632.1 OmpA family protein [Sphingomonas oryzagri]
MRLPALTTGSAGGSRWAMSFADLCLVLLGFLLLLQAHRGDPAALNAGIRAAFGSSAPKTFDETATSLFEPGEAILLPNARAHFRAIGHDAAGQGGIVHVESIGTDAAARRFDAWELAAARAAAIARAVSEGGLDAKQVDLAIDGTGPASRQAGQHVRVTITTKGG